MPGNWLCFSCRQTSVWHTHPHAHMLAHPHTHTRTHTRRFPLSLSFSHWHILPDRLNSLYVVHSPHSLSLSLSLSPFLSRWSWCFSHFEFILVSDSFKNFKQHLRAMVVLQHYRTRERERGREGVCESARWEDWDININARSECVCLREDERESERKRESVFTKNVRIFLTWPELTYSSRIWTFRLLMKFIKFTKL